MEFEEGGHAFVAPGERGGNLNRTVGSLLTKELSAIAFYRSGDGLQSGAPAAFAQLIRVDKIIGSLAALGAFHWDGPRDAANVEPTSEGLPFHPLAEIKRDIAIHGLFVGIV